MKPRILKIVLASVALLALAAPMTSAQAPQNYLKCYSEWLHSEMTVPDNGKADMAVTIRCEGSGFVCTGGGAPTSVKVQISLESFAKWAGSSMEPKEVTVKPDIQPGYPATGVWKAEAPTALNLAWNVEDAPKAGAKQDYVISIPSGNIKLTPSDCAPSVAKQAWKSPPMTAGLPDRPVTPTGTGVDCATDPFQAACQNLTPTDVAKSPSFDVSLLALAIMGLVFVLRRHVK